MTKSIIVILGPTASGKTNLGINIAKYYNTNIISADSRQIYKDLKIGTAQPTKEENDQIKHYLVDFVNIEDYYSVAQYEQDSLKILYELFKKKDTVIIVGGTGFYIDALCNGIDEIPKIDDNTNIYVNDLYKNYGLKKCVDDLVSLDNNSCNFIDLNNPMRVLRALKVLKSTGKPIYTYFNKTKKSREFNIIYIGINLQRDYLYERINKRVDIMINNGLIDEAKKFEKYQHYNSLNTIGYKEIYEYLNNKTTLEEAIENIKLNTRHYAKRQMTWFRKNKEINWFENTDSKNIVNFIYNKYGI